MSNALVAGPIDTATPFSGAGLLDSGTQLASAIESGNWVEGGLAAFSTVADAVATAIDPLGSLIAAGLGWLIDHFEPIKGWFNDLTGDAGAVAGFSQTWTNVQNQLNISADYLDRVVSDLDDMAGEAIEAYRRFQTDAAAHIRASGQWAGAMATGLQIASTIVQVVHDLVRDILSQLVGSAISWATEAVVTVGLATPWIISQVSSRVASWTAKISGKLTGLLRSCGKLGDLLNELRALMSKGASLLEKVPRRAAGGRPAADAPSAHPHEPTSPLPDPPPVARNPSDHLGPSEITDATPGHTNIPDSYQRFGDLSESEFVEKYWNPDSVNYDKSTGGWRYPPDDGFDLSAGRAPKEVDLPEGYIMDRYGEPYGRYTSPSGTPFPERAIPPDSVGQPYFQYRVTKPFDEESGMPRAGAIAPWFEQPGGGVQFHLPKPVQWLEEHGYLTKVEN